MISQYNKKLEMNNKCFKIGLLSFGVLRFGFGVL